MYFLQRLRREAGVHSFIQSIVELRSNSVCESELRLPGSRTFGKQSLPTNRVLRTGAKAVVHPLSTSPFQVMLEETVTRGGHSYLEGGCAQRVNYRFRSSPEDSICWRDCLPKVREPGNRNSDSQTELLRSSTNRLDKAMDACLSFVDAAEST